MKEFVLLTEKSWHLDLFSSLCKREKENWTLINKRAGFSVERLRKINPTIIFIPHWSHIIPREIWESYTCIVFHMTDLPYGRGGSPLQNLIARGHKRTKISALKVNQGIDTGDIYLKKQLDLSGSAQDIFERSVPIIECMITEILDRGLKPVPQEGESTLFKRRTFEQGNIGQLNKIDDVYNYIRMLDAQGYPNAYLETDNFKIEFRTAGFNDNNELTANVRITKK